MSQCYEEGRERGSRKAKPRNPRKLWQAKRKPGLQTPLEGVNLYA